MRPLTRRRGKRTAPVRDAAVNWEAISRAVALMTAENLGTGDSREFILGGFPPGPVIDSLVMVSGCLLRGMLGGGRDDLAAADALASALRVLGKAALKEGAR